MKRVLCCCALLSLSAIVENNTTALQQGAEIGQRGWTGDVDAICFLTIINSLLLRSARDITLPCTVACYWPTQ